MSIGTFIDLRRLLHLITIDTMTASLRRTLKALLADAASARTGVATCIALGAAEAIPAALARPRDSATARALARSRWLVRRCSDGRFLACLDAGGRPRAFVRGGLDLARRPAASLSQVLAELGIRREQASVVGLPAHAEPARLVHAGSDRYGRPLWLQPGAARAWRQLQRAARHEGVVLEAISGFRSIEYQAAIIRRKLKRGQTLRSILAVNAAPGYSEHHSGRALDIGTPGEPAAEESFELTAAFAWLESNAARFGFSLSYPRGNPSGIQYEPWHWCWRPIKRRATTCTPPASPLQAG